MHAGQVDLDELAGAVDAEKVGLEDAEVVKGDEPDVIVDRVADVHDDAFFAQFNDHELDVQAVAKALVQGFRGGVDNEFPGTHSSHAPALQQRERWSNGLFHRFDKRSGISICGEYHNRKTSEKELCLVLPPLEGGPRGVMIQ